MQKEDFEELKEWLIEHDYYAGSSAVANALRELADYWEGLDYENN